MDESTDPSWGRIVAYRVIRCNLYVEEPEAALNALTSALNDSINLGERTLTYQSHELLANAYRVVGDIEQAFHHFQAFHTIKESVCNIRSEQKIEQMKILCENRMLKGGASSSLPTIPNHQKNNTEERYQAPSNNNPDLADQFDMATHEIRSQLAIINIYNSLLKSPPSSLPDEQRENAHTKIGKAIDTISRQLVDQSAYIEQNRS